jgi:hypothetical protein
MMLPVSVPAQPARSGATGRTMCISQDTMGLCCAGMVHLSRNSMAVPRRRIAMCGGGRTRCMSRCRTTISKAGDAGICCAMKAAYSRGGRSSISMSKSPSGACTARGMPAAARRCIARREETGGSSFARTITSPAYVGTALNNVYFLVQRGTIIHYNGSTFETVLRQELPNYIYTGNISTAGKLVLACGNRNHYATILRGYQQTTE